MQGVFGTHMEGFLNPREAGIERAEGTVAQVIQVRSLASLLETPRCKQGLPASARDASAEGRIAGESSDPQAPCSGAGRAVRTRIRRVSFFLVHFHGSASTRSGETCSL